jgi:hypothetical protein
MLLVLVLLMSSAASGSKLQQQEVSAADLSLHTCTPECTLALNAGTGAARIYWGHAAAFG